MLDALQILEGLLGAAIVVVVMTAYLIVEVARLGWAYVRHRYRHR